MVQVIRKLRPLGRESQGKAAFDRVRTVKVIRARFPFAASELAVSETGIIVRNPAVSTHRNRRDAQVVCISTSGASAELFTELYAPSSPETVLRSPSRSFRF